MPEPTPKRGPLPAPLYAATEIADYLRVSPQWVGILAHRLHLGCKRSGRLKLSRHEAETLIEYKDKTPRGRPKKQRIL